MAKIKIVADTLAIESARTVEEICTLQKYAPKALRLYEADEETGKKAEVFRVAMAKGCGSVTSAGICFTGESRDGSGKAVVTMAIPEGLEDVRKYAADEVGGIVMKLNRVERQFDEALAQVADAAAEVAQYIEVF